MKIDRKQTIGQIIEVIPAAMDVFHGLGVDYCCGGNAPFEEALADLNLDVNKVEATILERVSEKASIEEPMALEIRPLLTYIHDKHHIYAKESLTVIDDLMKKVLKAHYRHQMDLVLALHRNVGLLKIEMEAHLEEEEEELFPAIQGWLGGLIPRETVDKLVKRMEDEHDGAGDLLKKIEQLTDGFTPPEGACPTQRHLYERLHDLQNDVFQHIFLENTVLVNKLQQ